MAKLFALVIDRRGNIVERPAFDKASEWIKQDAVRLADLTSEELEQYRKALANKGLDLRETSRKGRYVVVTKLPDAILDI